MAPDRRRRNRITVLALLGVLGVMVGLDIAAVPLYRLFCAATGYNGTTQRAAEAPAQALSDKLVTVRFNAEIAADLAWEFRPLVASLAAWLAAPRKNRPAPSAGGSNGGVYLKSHAMRCMPASFGPLSSRISAPDLSKTSTFTASFSPAADFKWYWKIAP